MYLLFYYTADRPPIYWGRQNHRTLFNSRNGEISRSANPLRCVQYFASGTLNLYSKSSRHASSVRNIELEIDQKLVPQQQRQAIMDETKRQPSEEEGEEVENGNTSSSSTFAPLKRSQYWDSSRASPVTATLQPASKSPTFPESNISF